MTLRIRHSAAGFLFACALFASCCFAGDAAAELRARIPYRIAYEGWYTIPVTVNGEGPYDFIIDTGATSTIVFRKLADLQNMPATNLPLRRILGLVGAQKLPVYEIGRIDAGGVVIEDLKSVVIENWTDGRDTPYGVLGLDMLSKYVVRFDKRNGMVELLDPHDAPSAAPKGWGVGKLRREDFGLNIGSIYQIEAKLQGRRISFVLDLGAAGTIINYAALKSLYSGLRVDGARDAGFTTGSRINDVFSFKKKAVQVRLRTVAIGKARWHDRIIVAAESQIFEELGVANKPMGFFGSDNFTDRSFIIDFPNNRLFIESRGDETSGLRR